MPAAAAASTAIHAFYGKGAPASPQTLGRSRVFKILHLDECPVTPMEGGRRGEQIKLINMWLPRAR